MTSATSEITTKGLNTLVHDVEKLSLYNPAHSENGSLEALRAVERQLGETEVSYFLPSRESGVNDMYLHLGCLAQPNHIDRDRIRLAWTIMRLRHPLLGSKVIMNDYNDIRFRYETPLSPDAALTIADQNLEFRSQTKDALIDSYLNGRRTLSNERLSYLVVAFTKTQEDVEHNFDFLICATHFLGDGMALHQFANDFFGLLGGSIDEAGLRQKLEAEWKDYCASEMPLPSSLEDRLPLNLSSKFRQAAAQVDFQLSQKRDIGGHAFPKQSKGERHTVVPTVSYDSVKTKKILSTCKTHGVSISAALFAICNVAWSRVQSKNRHLPIMMYSALNLRPNLRAEKRLHDSYWFIAIGYFNIILPSFLPIKGDLPSIFWHRARSAKVQSASAAKHSMAVSRCFETAKLRGARARLWAKEDDDKAAGIVPPPKPVCADSKTPQKPKVPSTALMGLSLLGNLDGIYKHVNFPSIKMHTLTTGSRQRSGGMLLFGYTFAGKLWVSFGYDENGIEEATVKCFWDGVANAIDEFLA
ncbi:hypothetical protein CPB83DRAFT_901373 [Crepidotus variabilis]|uniref:Alcohol acetyltransferase n=1 Tax=Crepidotus variabilis TaxID=179855 RepID=A0A9P6JWW9_9AGAR|nr:hypothetical protein CPB83DRAFT_901373 [Crepidotus variabilis]